MSKQRKPLLNTFRPLTKTLQNGESRLSIRGLAHNRSLNYIRLPTLELQQDSPASPSSLPPASATPTASLAEISARLHNLHQALELGQDRVPDARKIRDFDVCHEAVNLLRCRVDQILSVRFRLLRGQSREEKISAYADGDSASCGFEDVFPHLGHDAHNVRNLFVTGDRRQIHVHLVAADRTHFVGVGGDDMVDGHRGGSILVELVRETDEIRTTFHGVPHQHAVFHVELPSFIIARGELGESWTRAIALK
ncbi:hypothetical protein L596_001461 [Steinernema carpocapsae]|uniref:Uncharacterized protein n=1 Tax=Steinernema carpocapsae TaxID=34508 RepID=A0A4V6I7E0_STECR|nr:hypothetical protein L596_001461 [Steinernema carpocapsae]